MIRYLTVMHTNGHNDNVDNFNTEAIVFGRYLLHKTPSAISRQLYAQHMALQSSIIDDKNRHLLEMCIHYPWIIGCIDAGLALLQPTSEVRRRLYIMFAILETDPDMAGSFLPRERSPLYIVVLMAIAMRAVLRAILGVTFIKALRL